ncbi:MAG: hypothetical protein ABI357_07120 [Granulicella sp.]
MPAAARTLDQQRELIAHYNGETANTVTDTAFYLAELSRRQTARDNSRILKAPGPCAFLHSSSFIAAFNQKVFQALKPGGVYFILDHGVRKLACRRAGEIEHQQARI